jgi:hypothetical protein
VKNLRRHRIRVDENIGASSRARRSRSSRTLSIEVTVRFGQDRKLRIRSAASGASGCRGVSRSSSQNTGCFLSPVGTGPANRAPLSRFPLSRAGSPLVIGPPQCQLARSRPPSIARAQSATPPRRAERMPSRAPSGKSRPGDAIELSMLFVVRIDHIPRRQLGVRVGEHRVLRF